jgi:hypothetical protein
MTYKALKAKATPGPLAYEEREENGWGKVGLWKGEELLFGQDGGWDSGATLPDSATGKLLAHCFNNFDDLLRIATNCVERMKSEYPESQWVDEGIVEAEAVLNKCREVKA